YEDLTKRFSSELGGNVKLLLAYLSAPRNEGLEVDRTMADHDAKALFKAGEKRHGTDEKIFRVIFSGRSRRTWLPSVLHIIICMGAH
nr:annexin D5-like [Tanacetum cinerariifolium]